MASILLPSSLQSALDMRSSSACVCPPEVTASLSSIPFFRSMPARGGGGGVRFAHLAHGGGSGPSGWRAGGGAGRSRGGDDGFQTPHRRKDHRGGGGDHRGNHRGGGSYHGGGGGHGGHSTTAAATSVAPPTDHSNTFSSAAVKAAEDVEDRILAKVKGKINKIGPSTYDATKSFMQQILDSNETEFLDEFMRFVFQKAATESAFCSLYARLLHELADEFTHLRTTMIALFRDYTYIFSEVSEPSKTDETSYKQFVEAQERKKFRRGYSQFVAELVKAGEVSATDFGTLITNITTVLESNYMDATKTLLCEEYIDCLANMCTTASTILCAADWSPAIRDRIHALSKKPRAEVPGITNKARFALMDLVDAAHRGWKA